MSRLGNNPKSRVGFLPRCLCDSWLCLSGKSCSQPHLSPPPQSALVSIRGNRAQWPIVTVKYRKNKTVMDHPIKLFSVMEGTRSSFNIAEMLQQDRLV